MTSVSETDSSPVGAGGRPLKILIGADTFPPDVNGAARFAARLAAGLVARGHDVHVIAPAASRKHGTIVEEHEGERMTVHRIHSLRYYPHDWLRFSLPWRVRPVSAEVLDEFQPDVVHIQSHILVGRGLAREAAARGIRIIATNHFMPENIVEHTLLPPALQRPAIRWAWKDAAATFALAEAVTSPTRRAADFLEQAVGLRDVYAISCGIDASQYRPVFAPRTENRILFVGRVTGEKNIDVLLRAVAELDPSLDVKLDIVGGGDLEASLQQLATTLGIRSRVTFTGYVSEQELHDAYSRATVFAMPSIAELQSIATLEAMASALPVVAARAMALPHLVRDGENGYLFEPSDVKDLVRKLTTLLTLPAEEFDRFKRTSLAYTAPHDIVRTLRTFESLYRGLEVTDPVTDVSPGARLDGNGSGTGR